MSDRARAIEVLRQARDRLARQLMEHVLEAPEEILEEADGVSYGGRIETIYEHFGSRLVNVSSMMGQLQMLDDDEGDTTSSSSRSVSTTSEDFHAAATVADTLTASETTRSDPPLVTRDETSSRPDSPATWETFVERVRQDDLPAAVRALAELFELEESRAARCVARFAELCREDGSMFARSQQMRPRLRAASMNDALAMLWRLFGLQGPEAIGVYQALRVKIERRVTEPGSHE